MHPPNQRLGKPDKLSHSAHSQTSYPKGQLEIPWIKGDCKDYERGGRQETEKEQPGDFGEHTVTVKKHIRIYPCFRKLADRHKAQDTSQS